MKKIMKYSYSVIDEKPKSYNVIGGTYKIPESLKQIALTAYNDLFKEQNLTEDEFEEYFGAYYLNIEPIYDESENIKLIIFVLFVGMSLITVTCILIYYFKQRK